MLEIKQLVENRHKIPDEFWLDEVFWFYETHSDGLEIKVSCYDWDAERIGLTKDGNIVWAFDSGCSCTGEWADFDLQKCPTKSHKEFILSDFMKERDQYSEITTTEDDILKSINNALLLVREDVEPKEVLSSENAEIRRYLIKRIGYEKIKADVGAKVLHTDGTSELLRFKTGEMYVKVKDSSTDREYLLFVKGNHETCKSAIAWTFGLREHEYNPIIET